MKTNVYLVTICRASVVDEPSEAIDADSSQTICPTLVSGIHRYEYTVVSIDCFCIIQKFFYFEIYCFILQKHLHVCIKLKFPYQTSDVC